MGTVKLGDLRRLTPIDGRFGYGRGQPVDRHYIEQFLAAHASDIYGTVLEVGDASYTRRFGGSRVIRSEVLSPQIREGVTLVGDLSSGEGLTSDTFDCAVITQTLLLIYDVHAALTTLRRILKSGGVLLLTVPGICQIARADDERWGDFWRFTPRGTGRLVGDVFGADNTRVESRGNVLSATAFLYGLAAHELTPEELAHHDPDYPVTIAVRAEKR